MIKSIILVTKFIVIALVTFLFSSCNYSIKGSGHVTTEKRLIKDTFKNIEVSNAIEVVIEQANEIEVDVVADDNLQNKITTNVENGVLIIGCEYNSFMNVKSKKVIVKMPIIEALQASGAATISSTTVLKGDNLSINASSASEINLKLEFDSISSESSSGSTITLIGKALQLKTGSSSGSSINAEKLMSNEIVSNASSGGSIDVYPIVSLNAKASSGGNVSYYNVPKSLKKTSSSGGSVDKE